MQDNADVETLLKQGSSEIAYKFWGELSGEWPRSLICKGRGVYPALTAPVAAVLWLEDHFAEIYRRVCEEWDCCTKVERIGQDPPTLVLVLSDLLISVFGGIPAVTASALLVKVGLKTLCGCRDGKPHFNDKALESLRNRFMEKAMKDQPQTRYDAFIWVARQHAKRNNMEKSIARLEDAEKNARGSFWDPLFREQSQLTGESLAKILHVIAHDLVATGELKRAEELANEAMNVLNDDPDVMDSLGWVLIHKGGPDLQGGTELLERAFKHERLVRDYGKKGFNEVGYHLAVAYNKAGEGRKLKETLATMSAIGGENEWLEKARKVPETGRMQ